MENKEQKSPDNEKEIVSAPDQQNINTPNHEEEGGTDYSQHGQGGQGAKSTDGDENSSHDQGNEESIAGREDS
ncbi:hypothetical protein AHMF7605_23180 [Adhaeribacter arboris]|uniref:Uncharacterized protein n=1 Tax=Adhaeribacter arboris TaxID=2072846 RepID=A0A2T2YL31_9BACT|nr:hypothetical protein [Adhaeribacter arboris]PSR56199.1 hypothetical protein AHMF7605_23180 [Adhaeribacter arboris]